MRAWVVRFVSLYVFDVAVLLLIGLALPGVRVGWTAFWAALLLTAATIWLKPFVTRLFRGIAARSASGRTRVGEKVVQGALIFVVELIVWILVVILSGVDVRGWFWGWILPPVALLVAFAVYDLVDDRIEARTGALYDRATGRKATDAAPAASTSPAAPTTSGPDPYDGLTDEQRRMLDDLGKS